MSPLPSLQMPPVRKHGMPLEFAASFKAPSHRGWSGGREKEGKICWAGHHPPLRTSTVEITGVFGSEAQMFFWELGRRIRDESGGPLVYQYLLQRISVMVQRGNAAAVLGTFSPMEFDLSTLSNSLIQHVAHASVLSFTVLNVIAVYITYLYLHIMYV